MLQLVAGILLLGAVSAQAATYTDRTTKLRFPDKLGSWEKDDVHRYDDPALGTSLTYRHPLTGVATFYIYSGGRKKIPSGGKSDVVMHEFAGVLEEIEATYSKAEYENLKQVMQAAPEVQSNGRTATLLAAVYSFAVREQQPPQRLSYVLLTGFRNRFLKLRFTLPADVEKTPDRGQTELKQLITALLAANKRHAAAFWDAGAPADGKKQTTDDLLKAIQQFKEDPMAALERGVAKTIVDFAEASPAVMISFSAKAVPWIGNDKVDERRSVLLAAYIAGNPESQLRRGKKEDDPPAGVSQAIATYRQLQRADPAFRLEEVDALITLEAEGRLNEHLSAK